MYKEFYQNIIAQAEDLGQLRIIHKFLVCDLGIQGRANDEIRNLICAKEAVILLDMQKSHIQY